MNNVWATETCYKCDEELDENLQNEDCEVCNPDMVNSPPHYNQSGVECIDAISAATGDNFKYYLQGNIIKYLWRFDYKGKAVEDLNKAKWYLDKLIEHVDK